MDKQQVIDTYIEKNNNKSILGFLGINKMLGIDKAINQYLSEEKIPDITSTKKVGDFLKGNILINFFLKDKKNELDKLKEYLNLHKNNQAELTNLAAEIKKGTEVEKAISSPIVATTNIAPTTPITEVDPQNPEIKAIKAIKNSIEIKGAFADIKEVKNSDGKTILECKGESPYIHTDALDDILGLAQDFFQKTGKTLTLSSAYRTLSHQESLKKKKGNLAATPGESGHNLGLSIDMDDGDRYSKKIGGINGMRELAKKYNFLPLATEDWHFDYKTLPDPGNRLAQAKSLDKDFQERNLA